ncbi:MAG: type II CRISPR RNA-guided endonuclease Cas9, partial [Bacteroidaceae bacterium]|nr:type II CRISPR RNA-guided endonuclease Cas9 [Bacteroidaceae bacterium]
NNAEKAFSNLEENPIWLNREKGIDIKTVTIFAVNNADPLHDYKCDHHGNPILDEDGNRTPCDYVQTSNNHHAALYIDADGNVQEQIVPLFEAVARANAKMPIVDTEFNASLGWKFLFSIKKNECFVFPNPTTGFNPKEIDLNDPNNYQQISQNLYRVQKFSSKYYVFRHHLETTLKNDIMDVTFKRIRSLVSLTEAVKVRINHAGKIVKVNVD